MPRHGFEACADQEYDRHVQASPAFGMMSENQESGNIESCHPELYPNRESINEALGNARPSAFNRLMSDYFDYSEKISDLCLVLSAKVDGVRALYSPINDLLEVICDDSQSFSQSQCDWAFEKFILFDSLDNPFACSDSQDFGELGNCFFQLKHQLEHRLRKSRSRIPLVRGGTARSASRLIDTAGRVATEIYSLVATCLALYSPKKYTKKVKPYAAQLNAAAKGTYVIYNDLDTIDRLVSRLNTAIDGDKLLVRLLGYEMGRNRHSIQEVVKQLRRSHSNIMNQLSDLQEHMCLCFKTVNKARSMLFHAVI